MQSVGRPRNFDRDHALARAMEVFWARGYEGTSLSDLTAAMAIGRPSLYAAFGNKEDLFAEALALYEAVEGSAISRLLAEAPTARAGIAATLRHNARVYVETGRPRGCMIVLSSLVGATECEPVRKLLAARRAAGEEELRLRIVRGQAEGDVSRDVDPGQLAAFITAVLQGMSVKARDGAGRAELDAIVDTALRALP